MARWETVMRDDGMLPCWCALLLLSRRKSFSALFFLHMIFALMGGCRCMMRRRTQRQSGSSNTTSVNNAICVSRCIIFKQNERQRTDSNYDSLDSTRNIFQVGQCSKFIATLSLSLSHHMHASGVVDQPVTIEQPLHDKVYRKCTAYAMGYTKQQQELFFCFIAWWI